jgi:hypothetical protein
VFLLVPLKSDAGRVASIPSFVCHSPEAFIVLFGCSTPSEKYFIDCRFV